MLKLTWSCSGCGSFGDVEDTTDIYGVCPKCYRHKGEVEYCCNMKIDEFLNALCNMSEKDISNNAYAIQICAEDLLNNL